MRHVLLAAACMLTGCTTPYAPAGLLFGGYSETRLAADSYKVFAEAESTERAGMMLDLRAAELTLAAGYQKFAVADRNVRLESRTNYIPGNSYTVPTGGSMGGVRWVQTPGRTETVNFGKGEMTIRMMKASDAGAAKAVDATATRARLEPLLKGG